MREDGRFVMTSSADVLKAIETDGPICVALLMDKLGREEWSIGNSIRYLRKRKMIHIHDFAPQMPGTPGRAAPLYKAGSGEDKKFVPKTRRQIEADYRARNQALIRTKARLREGRSINFWNGLL